MLVPQSPRTKRPSQEAYCAGSGRSSPSARRWASTCSCGGRRADEQARRVARREAQQEEHERQRRRSTTADAAERAPQQRGEASAEFPASPSAHASEIPSGVPRRLLPALLVAASLPACQPEAGRRGATVLFASGADLQSINPLLTQHPLARQVQRYVLLTTLARYDSALAPEPYLAREWRWSEDRRTLTFVLQPGVRWHDGVPTTARDVALDAGRARAIRRPAIPGSTDLAADSRRSPPPTTPPWSLRFAAPQQRFPDVLTDLAILPAHLLDTVPRGPAPAGGVERAAGRQRAVPVRRARAEPPLGLRRRQRLSRARWAARRGSSGSSSWWWTSRPPSSRRSPRASSTSPGSSRPTPSFVRRDPALEVRTFPLLLTYGIVLNTRRPPFDDLAVRRAVSAAIDRREIVDGYLYGFGTPATGPVPPGVPGYLPVPEPPASAAPAVGGQATRFELLTVGSGEAALEQMVQARLAAAGFEVTIRQLELSAFLARVYGPERDFDAAVLGIAGDLGLGYLTSLAETAGLDGAGGSGGGAAVLRRLGAGGVSLSRGRTCRERIGG